MNKDLTSQFIIYLAIILICVIGAMNFFFYHDHTTQIKESLENKVTAKMDFLESSIGYFLNHFEYELISELGKKAILADRDVVYISVKDSVGVLLYEEGNASHTNVKYYSRKILNNGKEIGVVNLSIDIRRLVSDQNKTLILAIFLMILSISLIGGMIYLFYRRKILHEFNKFHKKQVELTHKAHYDCLTSLSNRTLFNEQLHDRFSEAKLHSLSFSILFIDLDDFKLINDEHGHEAGDLVLKVVSQRMQSILREADVVSRLGGDEFGVLLHEVTRKKDIRHIAEKLLTSISEVVSYEDELLSVGSSIGIVVYNDSIKNIKEMIKMADTVMYQAKAAGGNNYKLYES